MKLQKESPGACACMRACMCVFHGSVLMGMLVIVYHQGCRGKHCYGTASCETTFVSLRMDVMEESKQLQFTRETRLICGDYFVEFDPQFLHSRTRSFFQLKLVHYLVNTSTVTQLVISSLINRLYNVWM